MKEKSEESIGANFRSEIQAGFPKASDIVPNKYVNLYDLIDRKQWKKSDSKKRQSLIDKAISENQSQYDRVIKDYEELLNGDPDESTHDESASIEKLIQKYRHNIQLRLNHTHYYGGRLEALNALKEQSTTGTHDYFVKYRRQQNMTPEDAERILRSYQRRLSDLRSGKSIYVPSLDMPILSVGDEDIKTGKLKDVTKFNGLYLAATGMVHSRDLSYQDGMILIPREQWPFETEENQNAYLEWNNNKRDWKDRSGVKFTYRGKEFVCVGTPDFSVVPPSYIEEALTDLTSLTGTPKSIVNPEVAVKVEEPNFREKIEGFAQRYNELSYDEGEVEDLFGEAKDLAEQKFSDQKLEHLIMFTNWFDSSLESYDYLLWLNREVGPIDSEEYHNQLMDFSAQRDVQSARPCAKSRLLEYQGLLGMDELLDSLNGGNTLRLSSEDGAVYLVRQAQSDICRQMYEVINEKTGESFPVVGHHSIARVALLNIGAKEFKDVNAKSSKNDDCVSSSAQPNKPQVTETAKILPIKNWSNRKLGLSNASFAACDHDNKEIIAAIALANLKKGEAILIGDDKMVISTITDKTISLTNHDTGVQAVYRVGTSKFIGLLSEVANEISSLQLGKNNPGIEIALERDSYIDRRPDGEYHLSCGGEYGASSRCERREVKSGSEQKAAVTPIVNQLDRKEGHRRSKQDAIVHAVVEQSASQPDQRTVLFRMKEEGTLNDAICGLTETEKGKHKWFLITLSGNFHELSRGQTQQLCERIREGAERELLFDSGIGSSREQDCPKLMGSLNHG